MDMNRILQMIWRQFGGKLMNFALKKGADHLDRRAQSGQAGQGGDVTPAQRAQKDSARQMAQRMKQIRSATRRFF